MLGQRSRLFGPLRRRAIAAVFDGALLGASVACASAPRRVVTPAPEAIDSVWYVSARARVDGQDSRRLSDSLEYGVAIYARPTIADPMRDAFDVRLIDSARYPAGEFVTRLRRRMQDDTAASAYGVYYVHGFGTSLHEGWLYVEEARVRSRDRAPWIAFCWPANGAGIDWPRSGQWLTRAYHDDVELASASVPALVRATAVVLQAVPSSQMVLASHSLGGTLLGDAITSPLGLRTVVGATRMRALAFIAPDMSASGFRESVHPAAEVIAERVVLYLSGRDRVLTIAHMVNDSARLAVSDGPALARAGVDVVDVSDGFVAEGWLQGIVGTHHAIRRASSTLFDLAAVLGPRRAAACRGQLATAIRTDDGVWRLTAQRPPAIAASTTCAPY